MKVLALHGSKRRMGNTAILLDEFLRGASDAGCEVEKIELGDLKMGDCLGCMACLKTGSCVQKDDAAELCAKVMAADAVVFASPLYFFTWTATMKRAIDRIYPIMTKMQNKDFYLVTAGGIPDESAYDTIKHDFEMCVWCYQKFGPGGVRVAGTITGAGDRMMGDAKKDEKNLKAAYEMGQAAPRTR